MKRRWSSAVMIVVTMPCVELLLCSSFPALGATAQLRHRLVPPDEFSLGSFGAVVAAVNDEILIGEPLRVEFGIQGRAYLFDGESGALKHTINNPEPQRNDFFATAVAGGDGWAFVSSRERVYAFDNKTGAMIARIDSPEPRSSNFGSGLAYGNESLLISAPSYSVPFGLQNIGRGYLFDASTGVLQHTLPNPQPNTGDILGSGISLVVFGDKVAIGSINDDSAAGRVWVFNRQSGETLFAINNPRPESPPPLHLLDFFGWSVAANEEIIVVGSNEDESSGVEGSGSVFVFDSSNGALLRTLFSPEPYLDGEFGRSVALTPAGDVLVGAFNTSVDNIVGTGRVFLFDGQTGNLLLDIPNPEPNVSAAFGWSVSALDDRIIVGAPGYGRVYVFSIVPEPSTFVLTGIGALVFTTKGWKPRRLARASAR